MRRSMPRCPLPLLPAGTIALGVLLGGAIPAGAATSALPSLSVHRTDDTLDCPDAAALAARVSRHMGRPALDPGVARDHAGLDVQMYRSEEGYTAVVQTGASTRTLSDRGPRCDGLTEALAITLAILLDELPPAPPSPAPPAPEPPPTPSSTTAPSPEPLPPSPPSSPAASATPPPETGARPSDSRPPVGLAINASLFTTAGTLEHPVSLAGTASLSLSIGRILTIEAGVVAFPTQRFGFPYPVKRPVGDLTPTSDQEVSVSLTTGLVRGCAGVPEQPGIPRFGGCLGLLVGALSAQGRSFVTNQSALDPWIAAETAAFVEQRLFWRVSLVSRAALLVPFFRRSLVVDGVLDPTKGAAFTPSPIGAGLDLGLRLSIW